MAWIEPLAMETWIINVLSGDVKLFTALALLTIAGLSGYFKMTGLILIYLIGVFFLMFSNYIDFSLYYLLISVGGLLIGYWISKVIKG
jgi:hypothetical protein